jgi:tetratricopeptide (TPR) repeat protein
MHGHVGNAYKQLGDYESAERHLPRYLPIRQRLLGSEHEKTLDSMQNLARSYAQQDRYAEAERLMQEALEARRCVTAGPR